MPVCISCKQEKTDDEMEKLSSRRLSSGQRPLRCKKCVNEKRKIRERMNKERVNNDLTPIGSREKTNRIMREGIEISIPYNIALIRYPLVAAEIMEQRYVAYSEEAKTKKPEEFKWFIIYIQPKDPETNDENEFIAQLKANSEIYLMARGYKWRGIRRIDSVPKQIVSRYQDRAKLICQSKKIDSNGEDTTVLSLTTPQKSFNRPAATVSSKSTWKTFTGEVEMFENLFNNITNRHPTDANPHLVNVIKVALQGLKDGYKENN